MFFEIKRGYRDRGVYHGSRVPEVGIDGYLVRLATAVAFVIRMGGNELSYKDLKFYMNEFHFGRITQIEMAAAICMWQRGGACST